MFRHQALATFFLLLTACSNQSAFAPGIVHGQIEGSLTQYLERLQDSNYLSDCDKTAFATSKEITETLDAMTNELGAVAKAIPDSDNYRTVTVGPLAVREQLVAPSPSGPRDTPMDWKTVVAYYRSIQHSAVDTRWLALSLAVQGILVSDAIRLSGYNVYLDKDSAQPLADLAAAIYKAEAGAVWVPLELSDSAKAFVARVPSYHTVVDAVQNGEVYELSNLDDYVQRDLKRYAFRPNGTITRTAAGDEIDVPLGYGKFKGPASDQLAKYVEDVWQKTGLKIKIHFLDDPGSAFRLVLGEQLAGRSYVSWDARTVDLFPLVGSRAIAHEIGHVLGFTDHYYEVWHPEKCGYVVQTDTNDIMSDHVDGSVTDAEWTELAGQYPVPTPTATPTP